MEDDTRRANANGRHSSEEWLLGLVRETIVGILDERDRRYQERFEAQQAALGKVEGATDKRFDAVNEFRKAMTDRDVLYMPRAEYVTGHDSLIDKMESHAREDTVTHDGISKRIEAISRRMDTFEGTLSGGRTTLITIGGIATFLVAVIVIGTFVFTGKEKQQPSVIYVPAPPNTLLPSTPPQSAPR